MNMITRLTIAVVIALVFAGCGFLGFDGNVSVGITDATVDADNVEKVMLKVSGIGFNRGTEKINGWSDVEGFDGSEPFNLLDFTDGDVNPLTNITLPAGQYNQVRFFIDAPEKGQSPPQNPGSYVVLSDSPDNAPLFIPSGSASGFKAVGTFRVPVNGTVSIVADFDVRKGLVYAGGRYILKPTIRLIVTDEAAKIAGSVTNAIVDSIYVVLAYEDGTYDASEAADPVDPEGSRFPNAVTSDKVDDTGSDYMLAFLSPQFVYDLVVARYDADGVFQEVVDSSTWVDIVVEEGKTTAVPIEL